MRCPRCQVALRRVTPDLELDDIEALECPRCEGHWLEEDELRRLEQVVEVHWVEVRHLPPEEVQQAPLTCPRCSSGATLLKLHSQRDRKVLMDACPECHGVWLDGGELAAIQEKGVVAALVDAIRFFVK